MKSGSIFRILNARNLGLIPPNHQHLPQDQIALEGRRCCALGRIKKVIYYELLKHGETVNAHRYHQQLIKLHRALRKKRHYRKRHDKLIFLNDNTAPHINNGPKLTWRHSIGKCYPILLTRPGTFWLSPVFVDALAERHFDFYEDVRKWLDEWFASKDEKFFWRDIHKLLGKWEKCIVSEGKYFE